MTSLQILFNFQIFIYPGLLPLKSFYFVQFIMFINYLM